MQERKIKTEHGTLWTGMSEPTSSIAPSDFAILFLHGNSASGKAFEPLWKQPSLSNYKLIAFDYPGHGRSEDAPDPARSYHQYANGEQALEVLRAYNIRSFIVLGWSSGGQVAMELPSVLRSAANTTNIKMLGAMVMGASPVRPKEMAGFRKDIDISALFKPDSSKGELTKVAEVFTRQIPPPAWLIQDIHRTDRRAPGMMVQRFFEGAGTDQVQNVHGFEAPHWIAIVNGADDPLVDLDYVDHVTAGALRLWRGKCLRIDGQAHAPFYDDPEGFAKLFVEFVHDCTAEMF